MTSLHPIPSYVSDTIEYRYLCIYVQGCEISEDESLRHMTMLVDEFFALLITLVGKERWVKGRTEKERTEKERTEKERMEKERTEKERTEKGRMEKGTTVYGRTVKRRTVKERNGER